MPGTAKPSPAFALLWCAHGAFLALLALALPAAAAMGSDPEWVESMQTFGLGNLIAPTRDLLAVAAGWWPWLAGLAALSLGAGLLRWFRPAAARWPLHAAATAHAVLGLLATVQAHAATVRLGGGIVDEAIGMVLLVAAMAWSSWRVERLHSTAAAGPD